VRQSLVRGSVFNVSIAQHQIRLSRLGAIGQRLKFVCSQDLIVWPHFYHYLALCQVLKGGAGAADPLAPAGFSQVGGSPRVCYPGGCRARRNPMQIWYRLQSVLMAD